MEGKALHGSNDNDNISVWKLIVLIATPLIFLPLVLIIDSVESRCAYVILIMTIYWMTESIHLSVTALLPIFLYPLLGVQSAADTAKSYFKDTNFLIFGSLLMAVGVEVSGLHYRIALRILLLFGARPQWLILGFMIVAGFLSMWISNTATCAMMMPIVIVVLEEIISQKRKITIENPQKSPQSPKIGENPSRKTSILSEEPVQKDTKSIFARKLSPEEAGICRATAIGVSFGSSVGGIGALTGATPNLILQGQLQQYYPNNNAITFTNWFLFGMPMQILFTLIGWIWLVLLFMGWRSLIRCFAKRTDTDLSIARLLRREYEKLGPMRFDEGANLVIFSIVIVLWVFRDPGIIPGWGQLFKNDYVSDSTPAIFGSVILFLFPSSLASFLWWRRNRVASFSLNTKSATSISRASCCTSIFKRKIPSYRPLLSWHHVQEMLPWSVILLMGGGFALADGVKQSGLSRLVGCSMQSSLSNIDPALVVLIFLILMTVVSEFASNSATASVFVPILLTVAESLHINPLYFGLAAAIGSSFGFMLPVATPPNMIVFERCKQLGIMGAAEMIKAGIGLDIICIAIAFITMQTTGNWIYQFGTYPTWAHSTGNFTACKI